MVHFASPSHATTNIACGTNLQYPIHVQSFEGLVIDVQYVARILQPQPMQRVALRWPTNWPTARLASVSRSNQGDDTCVIVEANRP